MSQLSFTPTGDLEVIPSKTSSNNDFDFLVGEWKIRNKKLKTRLNNCAEWLEFDATGACHKILNGLEIPTNSSLNLMGSRFMARHFACSIRRPDFGVFIGRIAMWSYLMFPRSVPSTAPSEDSTQKTFLKGNLSS